MRILRKYDSPEPWKQIIYPIAFILIGLLILNIQILEGFDFVGIYWATGAKFMFGSVLVLVGILWLANRTVPYLFWKVTRFLVRRSLFWPAETTARLARAWWKVFSIATIDFPTETYPWNATIMFAQLCQNKTKEAKSLLLHAIKQGSTESRTRREYLACLENYSALLRSANKTIQLKPKH